MMQAIFFMDIDTQRDFILREGRLYVPGAERLIPRLRRLFDFARTHSVTVISTASARAADDPAFADFPPHCVRGTDGQRKIDDTLMLHPLILENRPVSRGFADMVRKHRQIVVEKQEFDVFSNPAAEKLVRVLPPYAVIFGVPAEHSVRCAALGLRRLGLKAAVIQNAVLPLEPRAGAKAEAALRSAGVELISLDTLLGALGEG